MGEGEDFVECDTCRAKPGTPQLCLGCLHNRKLIADLKVAERARVYAQAGPTRHPADKISEWPAWLPGHGPAPAQARPTEQTVGHCAFEPTHDGPCSDSPHHGPALAPYDEQWKAKP